MSRNTGCKFAKKQEMKRKISAPIGLEMMKLEKCQKKLTKVILGKSPKTREEKKNQNFKRVREDEKIRKFS